eukprot:1654572-Rhodomonas_salina.1
MLLECASRFVFSSDLRVESRMNMLRIASTATEFSMARGDLGVLREMSVAPFRSIVLYICSCTGLGRK